MASTARPIAGTTTHSSGFLCTPALRSFTHCTISAASVATYMITTPRMPNVLRNPDAVPGSVNHVDPTAITMLGATNAMAAGHGELNRPLIAASPLGHKPPRAPAKITREVWVFAAT